MAVAEVPEVAFSTKRYLTVNVPPPTVGVEVQFPDCFSLVFRSSRSYPFASLLRTEMFRATTESLGVWSIEQTREVE